jgi:hypothetical protein
LDRYIRKRKGVQKMTSLVNVKDVKNIGRGIEVATCVDCSERVVMGRFSNVFQHEIILEQTLYPSGVVAHQVSKRVDYCPNI